MSPDIDGKKSRASARFDQMGKFKITLTLFLKWTANGGGIALRFPTRYNPYAEVAP